MKRIPENDDKSHGENRTITDRTAPIEMTGDQNQPHPDRRGLDKSALAALIGFFTTLDRWDREAKK